MLKKSLLIQCALVVMAALVLLWTVPATADHHQAAAEAVKNVYICGCGSAANCDALAEQPGKAPCGKPLIEKQVLKEDADNFYVCACPEGCKCGLSESDPGKCSCGKELRAYPKDRKVACAHGMPAGCDQPCCEKPRCDKPCCDKPRCDKQQAPAM